MVIITSILGALQTFVSICKVPSAGSSTESTHHLHQCALWPQQSRGGGKEHSPDGEIWPGHELHVSMSLHVLTGQELLPYMACTSVLIPCMQHVPSQHLWAQVASLCCLQVFPSHYSQVTLESSFLSASILHNSASKSAHDPHRCDPCPQGGIWLVA